MGALHWGKISAAKKESGGDAERGGERARERRGRDKSKDLNEATQRARMRIREEVDGGRGREGAGEGG